VEDPASSIRLILPTVAGQSYALLLEAMDRVLRMVEVTPPPGAPDAVEGVVNIQGEVIPVASIRTEM